MYRLFISWRYFHSRRTNLIGVVGIFVAVGALIMILSIMTGFLDESRRNVRGSLSDVVVEPQFSEISTVSPSIFYPDVALGRIRADSRVRAASPRLAWYGILGFDGGYNNSIAGSSEFGDLMAVQLMGVDVLTDEKIFLKSLGRIYRDLFGLEPEFRLDDEFDTTDLRAALTSPPAESVVWIPRVRDPDHPFATPPGFSPEGRMPASVVVGEQLARNLNLQEGQPLTVTTAIRNPDSGEIEPCNREFVVGGTFRTKENEVDLGRIYLDRRELSDMLGGGKQYSEILVRLHDYDADGADVAESLKASLARVAPLDSAAGFRVRTWEEFRQTLLRAIENERVLMAIMLSLVVVVAGFTVFAILSMMVTEKRRDIGILCALGATHRGVMALFLMISVWDAIIGSVCGALAGIFAAINIDPIERALSETFGIQIFNRDVYLFDHIPSRVQPEAVAIIVAGTFLATVLFAAVPAWRAARLDPLEALRYE